VHVKKIDPIAYQAASHSKFSKLVDGGQMLPLRQANDPLALSVHGSMDRP
jgi:hypothetical protein